MNSMTIMTTFSVKNENTIPNMYNQSKNLTVHSNEKDREDKIIVYNIEKDFLIPMLISPIQNNRLLSFMRKSIIHFMEILSH